MKTSLLCVLLATVLCLSVIFAEARPLEEIKTAIASPTLLDYGRSSRMHVIFRHDRHVAFNCLTCHHKMSTERNVFLPCADAPSCHPDTNVASRTSKSYYLALHRLDSERSCLGCHVTESARFPRLDGCQTCHSALLDDRMQNR
ncbi:MAG: cytochrome c3 family protein [Deltaproteobacteria bacterium]|nr:cytochrome c3 family protein [Deltaproteobacteria bacterium]